MSRRAERPDVRPWQGVVAAENSLAHSRSLVGKHRDDEKWVVMWEAKEEDVDAWVADDESVRSYASYLMAPDAAATGPVTMRGVLRSDVVRRRSTDPGWE